MYLAYQDFIFCQKSILSNRFVTLFTHNRLIRMNDFTNFTAHIRHAASAGLVSPLYTCTGGGTICSRAVFSSVVHIKCPVLHLCKVIPTLNVTPVPVILRGCFIITIYYAQFYVFVYIHPQKIVRCTAMLHVFLLGA